MNTLVGILLLALGIVGLVIGVQDSRRPADQAARVVLGRYTQRTLLLLIGGAVALVLGLLLLTGQRAAARGSAAGPWRRPSHSPITKK